MNRLINNPIRRYDFVQKLEWFLISSVLMILVIRTQLWLTNYPQLGGNGLHIAHLLYGGIFMLIAIWTSLIYLNRTARTISAIIGGIGFGFFIDEVGKFITSDNNYFFKPAAGIIYIVFILMFLIIRELSRRQVLDPKTALANAVSFLPSTITGNFHKEQFLQANELLDQSDQSDPLVAQTREYFKQVRLTPSRPPSRAHLFVARTQDRITRLTERPSFEKWVITIVIIWGILALLGTLSIELNFGPDDHIKNAAQAGNTGFLEAARSLSILVSVAFVGMGVYRMAKKDHQRAYRDFGRALLVSIFITRVFSFIDSQFTAVFGLAIDIVLYSAIAELASRDSQTRHSFGGIRQSELPDVQNVDDGEEAQKS